MLLKLIPTLKWSLDTVLKNQISCTGCLCSFIFSFAGIDTVRGERGWFLSIGQDTFCRLQVSSFELFWAKLESWTDLWDHKSSICFWAFGYLYILLPCFQYFQWLRSEYVGHPEVPSDRHAVRSREQGLFTQNITWRYGDCYRKLGLLSQNMGINQATHIPGPTCQNSSFRFLLLLFVMKL